MIEVRNCPRLQQGESWAEVFLGMVKDVLRDAEEYEVKLPYEYKHIEKLFAQHKASFYSEAGNIYSQAW